MHKPRHGPSPAAIRLRPIEAGDLPTLYQFQLDAESNALAGTRPRDLAAFTAVWDGIFRDAAAGRVLPRGIVADDVLVGSINIFPMDGVNNIGYWIAREHWGRGITTRAIALLLAEVPARPIVAHVASHNPASLRALQRDGFAITARHFDPGNERYTPAEIVTLTLPP